MDGGAVVVSLVEGCPVRRREAPGLLGAEVCLGRAYGVPAPPSLEASGVDDDEIVADVLGARLAQQHLNRPFALVIGALAEVMLPVLAHRR